MRRISIILLAALMACAPSTELGPSGAAAVRILDRLEAEQSIEPDLVLIAARAQLALARVDRSHTGAAVGLLEQLDSLAVTKHGRRGWGLSYAWDAFNDDVVNPADTIYSYTTAAAGLAFLDGYEVLGDERWLDLALEASKTLVSVTCCWDDGTRATIWYSDQANDQHPDKRVHNVSGWTLALLERLSDHGVDIDRGLADRLARHLVDAQGAGWKRPKSAALSNWPYIVDGPTANDLLHEVFIAEGLLWRSDGHGAANRAIEGILATHFTNGWPRTGGHTRGTTEKGPPAGLYLLVLAGRDEADEIAAVLTESIGDDGTSSLFKEQWARALAWYALALAYYEGHFQGEVGMTIHNRLKQ